MIYKLKFTQIIFASLALVILLTGCATSEPSGTGIGITGTAPSTTTNNNPSESDTSEPLVSMFSFDGKIYYKTYEITKDEFHKQVQTDGVVLGTISTLISTDALPDHSLETNNPELVGKSIIAYFTILDPNDAMVVDNGGKLTLYQFMGACKTQDNAASGEFVSMFYYNGHLYTKAAYDIDYKLYDGYKGPLGTISTFVGKDTTPTGELETNDETLVGADIIGYYSLQTTGDTVVVDFGGKYVAYDANYLNETYVKPLYVSDKSTFTSEAEFLQEIKMTLLVSYDEISAEKWTATYGGSLAIPDYLPERFKHYEGVFVKADPGDPDRTISVHLWYDPDTFDILTITQEISTDTNYSIEFGFFDKDLNGQPISKTYPWANYCCSYGFTDGNGQIYGYMLVKTAKQEDECKQILTSIHD